MRLLRRYRLGPSALLDLLHDGLRCMSASNGRKSCGPTWSIPGGCTARIFLDTNHNRVGPCWPHPYTPLL